MGKRKRHVIGNLKKNMYVLEIKFNREYDEEIIEAIQKVPSRRRADFIRSILYMNLILGVKINPDNELKKYEEKKVVADNKDIESEIGLFIKGIKEGKQNE